MKILHINQFYTPIGGTEVYLRSIVSLLSQNGHQNIVIHGQYSQLVQPVNDELLYKFKIDETFTEKVSEVIARHKPDLAFLHTLYNPNIIRSISGFLPTICYVHSPFVVCPGMAKFFRRNNSVCTIPFGVTCIPNIYFNRCSEAHNPLTVIRLVKKTKHYIGVYKLIPKIIVGSDYMRDLLIQNGMLDKKITIIPPHFLDSVPPISPIPDMGKQIILYVGRLSIIKGIHHLILASSQMDLDHELLLVGEGEDRNQLEKQVVQLKIEDRVRFIGWLDSEQLKDVFRNSTLLVIPSLLPESFCKVGLEAMTHGRPVVAYNVGGIPDWLRDGYNGFLVPPGNLDALTNRIRELLINRDLVTKMGINSYHFATSHYSSENHYQQLVTIFESIRSSN